MPVKYQYINFIEIEKKPKTSVYICMNNRSGRELGIVKWYPEWKQYCYFPTCQAVYSVGCLEDINDFIRSLGVENER